jgi:hypothetical protein
MATGGPPKRARKPRRSRSTLFFSVAWIALLSVGLVHTGPTATAQSGPIATVDAKRFLTRQGGSLLVTIDAKKPIRGTVSVQTSYSSVTLSNARVELPTGGLTTLWMPIAGWSIQDQGATTEVLLKLDDGTDLRNAAEGDIADVAVAVLPSALGSRQIPNKTSTITTLSTARFAPISVDDLEQRPWILGGFAVIATTSRELAGASAEAQQSVLRWVRNGGELLIDDDSPVPSLGAGDQPKNGTPAPFGDGIIRRTVGAARAGSWDQLIYPNQSSEVSGDDTNWLTSNSIKLPPVGLMLGGMIFYTILVGPVLHAFLRKRKRAMSIWTIGPALAVLTTIVVLGIGLALRSQAADQFGVMTEYGPNGSTVVSAADTKSGKHTVALPAGWTASQATNSESGVVIKVERPLKAEIDVPPGGLRVIQAVGPAPKGNSPISGTATAVSTGGQTTLDGEVEFAYRNTSSATLKDVVVWRIMANSYLVNYSVGDIAAGASGTSTLSNTGSLPNSRADRSLLQQFRVANRDMIYVTAAIDSAPGGVPFLSGKQIYSGVMLRVPITGNAVTRAMNPVNLQATNGADAVTTTQIDPSAIGTADVSGEVWIDGSFVRYDREPLTPVIAKNGLLLSKGDITIAPLGSVQFPSLGNPGNPIDTTTPFDTAPFDTTPGTADTTLPVLPTDSSKPADTTVAAETTSSVVP